MPKKGNVNKNVSKKDKKQGGEYNSRMGGVLSSMTGVSKFFFKTKKKLL